MPNKERRKQVKDAELKIAAENRSSRPDVFCEKSVLRNFAKFTGKHLCQSLFFNKVACSYNNVCDFAPKHYAEIE